ncbi:MAG TPA: metallophosphoesterase [Jiangellaceae bacterium]|nr:metallophosphoesterase [Jiangellaceae bacterium]
MDQATGPDQANGANYSEIPRWLRAVAPWIATVFAGLFGAWLALSVAGTTQTALGPLAIDAEISPSWQGDTVLQVDPIGTLEFDTHTAPLRITVSLRSVDVEAVQQIVENPAALNSIESQLVADLNDALWRAAIRAGIVAVIGAVIAGGLVLRSWRRALLAGAVALSAVGLSYAVALATFDRDAVREPRYTGLIATAPRLIGSVEAITTNFGAYVDQLASLVTNVTRIYDVTSALPTWAPTDDTIRVLHVSDLHLNPAAWGIIRAVSDQYDIDVIVDAGDIADHGTAAESRYAQPISTLGRPYVYVKGNHDSILTAAAVAEQPNAIVLDYEPVNVAGLQFYGAPDPRFTPDQRTRGTASEDIRRGSEELAERARNLAVTPDVIVYHDPTHADMFDGTAPLILSGHAHRRRDIVLDDGTRVFVQGSTGGAGLRGLEGEEPTPIMLSVHYFDPETKQLVARDDITLGGLGLSSAEINRTQIEDGDETSDDEDTGEVAPSSQ